MSDLRLDEAQRRHDGRNVDPELGLLRGEGSQQRVEQIDAPVPSALARGELPVRAGQGEPTPTYYGQPAVKEPVWIWSVPLYLYVGGLAGAASLLGVAAQLCGRGRLDGLAKRCHWVGAVGDAVSGGLLIHDLGRPERFLNMLRVFRPKSPMSMGSWSLAGSGAANSAAVVLSHGRGFLGWAGRAAGVVGGLLGMPLAGYTAVLLCNSAVPLWQHTHRTLPLLFMSSSVASCGAFLELLPLHRHERRVVRVFWLSGTAAALAATVAVERDASRSEPVARPLRTGASGALWKAFKVCTVAGLGLALWPGRQRWKTVAASALTTVGALAMRFAFFHGGKASARDPQATFRSQRDGLGAAEVGPASQVLRDSRPDRFPLPVLR
ncbi:NrfD/PsrC family molybdoenzyme membrane anchor subunit [Hyalangium minutum]|uniref:Formate dehydrogenase O putative subunit protein n=1 Tax=Hyalangium minutum TaxID=394096 RepID=A0A085WWZ1_9BACT|nr:NrfD/PsrC family molybdoenzyme membrane anchor subunit [Hyalangium minutum]KFE72204.1 Formate dehydrogenase O putative subunit protein [Hyalangium minutum]